MGRELVYDMSLLEGTWPTEIAGHHWINAIGEPLPWHRSFMLAPGVVQRLDLSPTPDGRLLWHLRDSHAYDVQAALMHAEVFQDPATFNVLGGPVLTCCNNSFFRIDDRVFLTDDVGRPWEIDPRSMALRTAVGTAREWGGASRLAMLSPDIPTAAHPFYDEKERRLYDYTTRAHPLNGVSLSHAQRELSVVTWDGHGEVKRWEVPGAGLMQYVHEIACTRSFLILLESSSFEIDAGGLLFDLPKQTPQLGVANLIVIRKADLTEEARGRGVPFRKISVSLEAFHMLADYDDDGKHIDVRLIHGNGLDFMITNTAKDVHWSTGDRIENRFLGQYGVADYAPFGVYRIDTEQETVVQSHRFIEPERYWSPTIWCRDVRRVRAKDGPLYLSWAGFEPGSVSRRLMSVYGDLPNRIAPPRELPNKAFPPALTAINWKDGEVLQSYEFPQQARAIANQFIPRSGDEGGWIGVYLSFPRRRVEYWLFDAERIARGPVARIGCESLRAERVVHHAWTPEAPKRTAKYHVSVEDELGSDWRLLPTKLRRVVEDAIRLAPRPD